MSGGRVLRGRCLRVPLHGIRTMANDARMTIPGDGLAEADQTRVREILALVKPLAAGFYRLSRKPLGVTGEIAEYLAADILGLELAVARTAGYDAIRHTPAGPKRIQIKGRAVSGLRNAGRISRIKLDADCDVVLLVLMDSNTLDAIEMWEASYSAVTERLALPGAKSRERGALGISEFKAIAKKVWPA